VEQHHVQELAVRLQRNGADLDRTGSQLPARVRRAIGDEIDAEVLPEQRRGIVGRARRELAIPCDQRRGKDPFVARDVVEYRPDSRIVRGRDSASQRLARSAHRELRAQREIALEPLPGRHGHDLRGRPQSDRESEQEQRQEPQRGALHHDGARGSPWQRGRDAAEERQLELVDIM
jgi:hypothetical protein